nr:sugar phosphate nucleotidyltransferase [Gemmatimonadaceae bacterium]
CDFKKAVEFHKEKGAVATLILYRVPNPLEFGLVITDDSGKVVRFLEKPSWSEVFTDTVNTGMYILEPSVFELMEPNRSYDWSQDIFPKLLEMGAPIYGYVMDGFWSDVGSLQQYREAQEQVLRHEVQLPIPGSATDSGVFLGSNLSIDQDVVLRPPVVIGRNVKVKAGAVIGPYASIGDNCIIEEGAQIERSVIWERSYIGPHVSVKSAIVCSRATIKRECQLMEDSVVGDRCLVDVGTHIRPRVKLWPDKIVERGSHGQLIALGGRYKELYERQHRIESDQFINPGEDFTLSATR